ncbi:disulfide bond formation protein B, partial [Candidatus Liberibacter asiaticus]
MIKTLSSRKFISNLNILGLLGIFAVLIVAFYYQIILHEIPCPLCLLQRVGIIMIGIGFLFNL